MNEDQVFVTRARVFLCCLIRESGEDTTFDRGGWLAAGELL